MNRKKWTTDEDDYILKNYGIVTLTEMSKKIGCSIQTIQKRLEELGLEVERKTSKRWREEEIELLRLMAPKYLNKTISKRLDRSVQEVNKKARTLGIQLIFKRPVWQKWKIKFLKENINLMPLSRIQRELEVNYYQIMDKLEELNIEYVSSNWTEDEEDILIELAPKVYIREIAKVLNRSEGSVLTKANKMGLEYITLRRKFTEEELEYIRKNWGIIPITEMARRLKVSRNMIQNQANIMNLPKLGNNPYKKWTEKELKKLELLSKTKTITELARYFKTTNSAIITIANRKNIPLSDGKIHWTEEDVERLRVLSQTMDLSEIAIEMGRSTSAVRLQAERSGITIMPNKKHVNSIWTEENTKELKRLVEEDKTVLDIAIIMNKSDQTILKKARELGLKIKKEKNTPWTEDEIKILEEQAKTKTMSELVKILNRTSSSIKSIAKKRNITIKSDRKQWTEEEYKILERLIMVEKKTPKEVAEILNRSEDSVVIKINRRGLKIQTNDKRHWTEKEEETLQDLWGSISLERISKTLNRSISSIKNKAYQLGLGSYLENNYEGLTIKDISELLKVDVATISVGWVSLGLKCKVRHISKNTSYRYVEIKDLYSFLEVNQNIWDSRNLEKNILGKEPQWLEEKRKRDREENKEVGNLNLTKQQLILAKKFFLEIGDECTERETEKKLIKRRDN